MSLERPWLRRSTIPVRSSGGLLESRCSAVLAAVRSSPSDAHSCSWGCQSCCSDSVVIRGSAVAWSSSPAEQSVGCASLESSELRFVEVLGVGDVSSLLMSLVVRLLFCWVTESDTDATTASMGVDFAAGAICALMLSAAAWVACSPGSDITSCFNSGETT